MDLGRALFSFKGRMRRRDWWLFSLGLFAFETAVIKSIELVITGPTADLLQGNVFTWLLSGPVDALQFTIHAAVMVALIWPNLALTTKRAHDRDANGYWLNGVILVSYATFLLPDDLMQRSGAALDGGDWVGGLPVMASLALAVVVVATIVILGVLDGTPGPNRYGSSPKGGGETGLAEVFD